MTKFLVLLPLIICSSLCNAQTFQIDELNFLLYMGGISAVELSNNYFDKELNKPLTDNEILSLNKKDIPFFDGWIPLNYDQDLKKWSDYSIYFTLGASFITVYDDTYIWDNLMVLSKILITQSALCKWTKTFAQRKRPYMYSEKNKEELRQSTRSFYSSHSSTAFASSVFAYYYYHDNYGGNIPVALLLFGSAATTAALRVASAQHFPSDVLIGAIAGSGISYLMCKIHQSDRIKFNFGLNSINLQFLF